MELRFGKWIGIVIILIHCSGARELSAAPARIMPLGDSLTSSLDDHNSYRFPLWRLLRHWGYEVDFVGSQWGVGSGTQPRVEFDLDHEGHPGLRSDELELGVNGWAENFQPDIVLLLIGDNDLDGGFGPAHVAEHIAGIVAKLREVNPKVVVLVGSCPPQLNMSREAQQLHTTLTRAIPRLAQRSSPVRLVNLFSGLSVTNHTIDGYHLNAAGDSVVARRWAWALKPYLKNHTGPAAASK